MLLRPLQAPVGMQETGTLPKGQNVLCKCQFPATYISVPVTAWKSVPSLLHVVVSPHNSNGNTTTYYSRFRVSSPDCTSYTALNPVVTVLESHVVYGIGIHLRPYYSNAVIAWLTAACTVQSGLETLETTVHLIL